jgi:hypothetical protein
VRRGAFSFLSSPVLLKFIHAFGFTPKD